MAKVPLYHSMTMTVGLPCGAISSASTAVIAVSPMASTNGSGM